jgi:hypothetical protein
MTVSKPVKILIGVATFWYALYLLLTIASIVILLGYVLTALLAGGESVSQLRTLLLQIISLEFMLPVHVCSLFLEVGLLIFYLIHTIKNTKASDAMRIALGLGHLFLPFVAMPIYYWLYIWRENPPDWAAGNQRNVEHFVARNVLQ